MKLRIYVDLCVCGATFNSSHSCHAQIKNYVLFTKENCCGLRFVICISGFMYSMCAHFIHACEKHDKSMAAAYA